MRALRLFFGLLFILASFSGCLSVDRQDISFDYTTGILSIDYHDIRSKKDNGVDTSVKDWASVQEFLKKKDEYDPKHVAIKSKELFQQNTVLSGKAVYHVKCPNCFSSKTSVLKLVYSDGQWEDIHDEIFLFLPINIPVSASNGKIIKTDTNIICVWPKDTVKFNLSITYGDKDGESLLPRYLSNAK